MKVDGRVILPDVGDDGVPYCRCDRVDGNCPRFYDGARCEITRQTVLKGTLCKPAVRLVAEENIRLRAVVSALAQLASLVPLDLLAKEDDDEHD